MRVPVDVCPVVPARTSTRTSIGEDAQALALGLVGVGENDWCLVFGSDGREPAVPRGHMGFGIAGRRQLPAIGASAIIGRTSLSCSILLAAGRTLSMVQDSHCRLGAAWAARPDPPNVGVSPVRLPG